MSKGDWNKIIWSTGSQGKYKAIRMHCACACGHGTFIPVLGPSGQVQLCSGAPDAAGGEPVDSAGERRRLIEVKLVRQRELQEARARDEKDQRARERATATARQSERQGRPAEPAGQRQSGRDERGPPLWSRLPVRRREERPSTASETSGARVRVRTPASHDGRMSGPTRMTEPLPPGPRGVRRGRGGPRGQGPRGHPAGAGGEQARGGQAGMGALVRGRGCCQGADGRRVRRAHRRRQRCALPRAEARGGGPGGDGRL